ncbi:hypothetical protein L2E82_44056 [Cichorium intybus]|uniref:Uncharacterized protein n=1 Tax=Cichorium intybus TaxID=13427 RepID=A0ACB8ZP82_CICIN|nr:hypothetical protein L2E82_44056 [Cichorium intybus]
MNFNKGDEVSFFKILLCASVDYLPLPTAFAKTFLEKGNNKKHTLVLKPKSAIRWSVRYLNIEDKYYFTNGWLKFIKDNGLQVGDFLVFWLLSTSPKSIFQVFFYAPNGCLKHAVVSPSGNVRSISHAASGGDGKKKKPVKEETSDDDADVDGSLVDVRKSFMRVFKKSHVRYFWKATEMDRYNCVWLRNDERKTWEVKVSQYRLNKMPYLTTGWLDFWKGNKMNVGNMLEINHVKDNMLHVRVLKKKKKPKGRPWKKN